MKNWYPISYRFFFRFFVDFPLILGANLGGFGNFFTKKRRALIIASLFGFMLVKFSLWNTSSACACPCARAFWDRFDSILV